MQLVLRKLVAEELIELDWTGLSIAEIVEEELKYVRKLYWT